MGRSQQRPSGVGAAFTKLSYLMGYPHCACSIIPPRLGPVSPQE